VLFTLLLLGLSAGCGRDKASSQDPGGQTAESSPAGEEETPKTVATPVPDPRTAPRPPEPPLLKDGAYTGDVAAQTPGTLSFTVSEGRISEASASVNGVSFSLSGQVSGHKVSLGGKEGDDFLRFMGKGTDTNIAGSWMGSFSGQRLQGSWTTSR
ncbi:MAG: hypothetical protein VX938_07635, partial [Myxococcota bacterium]|nr:hypothetical protein [Myxococcota bacterium]